MSAPHFAHLPGCPLLMFWDAGEAVARCTCDPEPGKLTSVMGDHIREGEPRDEFSEPEPVNSSVFTNECPRCETYIDDLAEHLGRAAIGYAGPPFPCPHCGVTLTCTASIEYVLDVVPQAQESVRDAQTTATGTDELLPSDLGLPYNDPPKDANA